MIYTDKTLHILDSIIEGKYSYEENIDNIRKTVFTVIGEADTLILCGTLPFTRFFSHEIAKTKNCYYLDSGDGEGMYAGHPLVSITDLECLNRNHHVVYVIMSRSMLEFYNFVIKKMDPYAKILYYASVELAYEECFNAAAREDYTPYGIKKSIKYIYDNAEKIKDILLALGDSISREIYARIVLFRLTFDINLNIGIKSNKMEYLDDEIIDWKNKEYVLDLGGYVGDTLYDFKRYFLEKRLNYEYYLLEPSKKNCEEAVLVAGDSVNIHILNCCAGDENREVYLGSMGSAITVNLSQENTGEVAQMVRLDDLMAEKNVTYIKMDIEGSEEIAIKGAENIIRKNRPKLAICIYHKYDDIVKLIEYVKSITDELNYSYYIRAQRESVVTEMVLYALPS